MDKNTNTQNNRSSKRKTGRQIAAVIGVVLLALLYIITLAAALLDNSATGTLFMLCLSATIALPVLIWIYTWMYGKLTGKHTFTDPDPNFKDGNIQASDSSCDGTNS